MNIHDIILLILAIISLLGMLIVLNVILWGVVL